MLIYLASPYSAPTAQIRQLRFENVCQTAARLMEAGNEVFCPIAHSHPIEVHGMDEIKDGDFWLRQDFAILRHCDALVIDDTIPGWDKSEGVYRETVYAFENNIPVNLLSELDEARAA